MSRETNGKGLLSLGFVFTASKMEAHKPYVGFFSLRFGYVPPCQEDQAKNINS